MDYAVDLHIHSGLSPCGDMDMTPNNIINMAVLKGIDIISVTDHNSTLNLPALFEVSIEKGILLLPGIEVQTKEDVHMLCYFKHIDDAMEFGKVIYSHLPNILNNEKLFGPQLIYDSKDNITGNVDKLLLSSADLSIEQLIKLSQDMDGICIPAHVDRSSYSIISNLGFIPENLNIKTIEISKNTTVESFKACYPQLNHLRVIKSSDAHYLWDISERDNFMPLQLFTLTSILNYLKGI